MFILSYFQRFNYSFVYLQYEVLEKLRTTRYIAEL